jgi:AI-2 transport protein TqsA
VDPVPLEVPPASTTYTAAPSRFERRLLITALSVLLVTLVVYLLKEFAVVLQQLLLAVFLVYLIAPIHGWLLRRGLPAWAAYLLIAIVLLLGSYACGQMLYRSVEHLAANLPHYRDNLKRIFQSLIQKAPGVDRQQLEHFFASEGEFFNTGMTAAIGVAGTFFGFLSESIVILVYLAFLLAEQTRMGHRIQASFEPAASERILAIISRINATIRQYVALKTLINLLVGSLTAIVLWLYRVDYALLWGILAFLLNYIPYLGSVIAIIPPVLLSLVEYESLGWSALVLTTLLVVHNGIGYLVEPRLTGDQLDLSPIVVLLALAFWGSIWGTVGMLLAIPLTVVIRTILENIPETRPFARMLASG